MKHRELERLDDRALAEAIGRTPLDHWVIWDGSTCGGQANSLRSRALGCVKEIWTPVQMRLLLQRAARLAGELGLNPDTVRSAVRMHQSARPAAYLLVRRTLSGDYLAVTDVPWPAANAVPLQAGDLVLDRQGRAFGRAANDSAAKMARAACA